MSNPQAEEAAYSRFRGRTALRAFFVVVLCIYVGRSVGQIALRGEPHFNNDEPRHLMTAVFWADFLRVLPVDDPVGFARTYYGHYPAIGPLHWPPLQHFLTGTVFIVTGLSVGLARLLVLAMSLVWIWALYRLVAETSDPSRGLIAAMLAMATYTTFLYSNLFMLEVPCLMWVALTMLALGRFIRTGKSRYIWLCSLCGLAGVLTKQHAAVLIPGLLAGMASGFQRRHWKNPHTYIAPAIALLLAGVYYWIALSRITSSLRDLDTAMGSPWPSLYWAARHTGPVLTVGGVVGLVGAFRRRRSWLDYASVGLVVGILGLFWIAGVKSERYLMYWSAPMAVLASGPIAWVVRRWPRAGTGAVGGSLVLTAAYFAFALPTGQLAGYRVAAARSASVCPRDVVLYMGKYDGPFILYRRAADPELSSTTLRTSKFVGGGNIFATRGYTAFVSDREEIRRKLRDSGVQLIVAEDEPEINAPEHWWLHEMLKGEEFIEVCRETVVHPDGSEHVLTMYRFAEAQPTPHLIELPMLSLRSGAIRFNPRRSLLDWPAQ